jgi:hypothetical protein
MGDMTRLGLQEEQEVAIFLGSFVIGKESFLWIGGIIEVACDFVLLQKGCVSNMELSPPLSETEIGNQEPIALLPLPAPFGSGSTAQFANRDIAHPSPKRSSSSTETRSLT